MSHERLASPEANGLDFGFVGCARSVTGRGLNLILFSKSVVVLVNVIPQTTVTALITAAET